MMDTVPVLKGKTVLLREIMQKDIEDRFALGKADEFVFMCGGNRNENDAFPPREIWESWYEAFKTEKYGWIIEFQGKCIGTARLHNVSDADRSAAYAVGIFDMSNISKGIGTEATKLILKYAFEELNFHRVEIKVLDYNKRAIRCYEKCGFKIDGILRENAFIEGKYASDIVMSILDREFAG